MWWGRNRSERVEPKTSLSGAAEHQPRRAQSKPVRQTTNPDFTELQASEERARKRLSLRLLTPTDRPNELHDGCVDESMDSGLLSPSVGPSCPSLFYVSS